MIKNFFRRNRDSIIIQPNTTNAVGSSMYDEIIKKDVFDVFDEKNNIFDEPKFSYFLLKKNNKWAISKPQMELLTGFEFDRIDVYREGNRFNVLLLEKNQQSRYFLIEENCNYKDLITADCKFIDLIPAEDFNEELFKFSLDTIDEYYRLFWMNNMSMEEDEACTVANTLRPIKNSLRELANSKFEEHKKTNSNMTRLLDEGEGSNN